MSSAVHEPTAAARPAAARHVAALDGIRGLAVLMVLVYHGMLESPMTGALSQWPWRAAMAGWAGVDLFFVLSGFLITGILWDTRGSPNYFGAFYGRRTVRIFPLYYLAIAIAIVPLWVRGPHSAAEADALHDQGWAWLYGVNVLIAIRAAWPLNGGWFGLGGFWSLAVEEHFYLLWPLVVSRIGRRTLLVVIGAVFVGAMLARAVCYRGDPVHWWGAYTLTPCRIDGLAAGAFVAMAVRDPRLKRRAIRAARPLFAVSGLVLFGWFAATKAFTPPDPFASVPGHSVLAVFFAAGILLIVTAAADAPVRRLFEARWLTAFGRYSYGLYVYQSFLLVFLDRYLPTGRLARFTGHHESATAVLRTAIYIAGVFAVAVASWHLYEKWWLKLKVLFQYKTAARPAIAAP